MVTDLLLFWGIEAKQPNSSIQKCVRNQLIKKDRTITTLVPFADSLNCVD
jgi:ribosomal protein S12